MVRVRQILTVAALTLGVLSTPALANHYRNVPNAHQLLEHLVRHTDELLTEVNLTRANQFLIINPVIVDIRAQGGWGGAFYSRMLVEPGQNRIPEYFIGKLVNDFRMQAIMLYDLWWRYRGPNPAFNQQFIATDYAYTNAIAATYFYIEALRRSYLVRGAAAGPLSNEILLRRLMILERLAWEIRELMMTIRYANMFRFPLRPVCLESTYRPYRVNVNVNVAQNFVPFPFYHENQMFQPQQLNPVRVQDVPAQGPGYDTQYWNNHWNRVDGAYLQGNNLPPNYNDRPYTPAPDNLRPNTNYPQQQPGYQPQQPGYQQQPQQPQQPGYQQQPQRGNPPVDYREPLRPQVNGQPGYPVPGSPDPGSDVVPNNDFSYN